ncbi:hypothetical protein Y88_2429 [Novosphingobium nitrogenifigens DSM 19370]|uniref:Uncharacterized protein n=1 Tax=Novosphingobium nitrogenifigens DSM 19370 TaxID=983920 RepID=F1Z6I5_9SPHN|nr:hypothetical protein Y88_2429 [Novosphingobium nitrogenifigens DSM 19370]
MNPRCRTSLSPIRRRFDSSSRSSAMRGVRNLSPNIEACVLKMRTSDTSGMLSF